MIGENKKWHNINIKNGALKILFANTLMLFASAFDIIDIYIVENWGKLFKTATLKI